MLNAYLAIVYCLLIILAIIYLVVSRKTQTSNLIESSLLFVALGVLVGMLIVVGNINIISLRQQMTIKYYKFYCPLTQTTYADEK